MKFTLKTQLFLRLLSFTGLLLGMTVSGAIASNETPNDAVSNSNKTNNRDVTPLASLKELKEAKEVAVQIDASAAPKQLFPTQISAQPKIPSEPSSTNEIKPQPTVKQNQPAPQVFILSPTNDSLVNVPGVTVILRLPVGMEVELFANGKKVDANSIGRTDVDNSAGTVTQTWYGVALNEGENNITARLVGTDTSASVKVRLRGAATQIRVSTLESRIPADGRTTATVQGLLLDEKGDRSNRGGVITLAASDGEFIGVDAKPDIPGFQVEAREGQFSAVLKASLSSGNVRIRASSVIDNREVESFTQLQFETNLRPSIVTGVIDLRFGARGTDYYRSFRDFLPADRNNSSNVDFYSAAFGTGRVGEWLVTGAFNTRRTLNEDCEGRSRLFRDIQFCQQIYPVYGDSSTLTTETPSLTSIFLRAERTSSVPNAGTDFFMWGDFRTEEFASRAQEFTSFTRQLNGLKFNYNLGNFQGTGFYSTNTRGFQRDIIPPDGTSGFFFLSRRLVVPGSENVFVEWEELLRPGNVVRRVQFTRSQDYEIDYDRGSLQFRVPIPQTDIGAGGETLVRRIVTSYEYENEGGANTSLYAGQLRYHFDRTPRQESWLGFNYFKENQGSRDFQLYGANALVSFGESSYLIAEYARSQNRSDVLPDTVSGSALRFEAVSEFLKGITGKAYYRQAETGFVNNATVSFVPGQTRFGASIDAQLSDSTKVRASYEREENRGVAPQAFTLSSFLDLNPQSTPGTPVDNQLSTFSFGLAQKIGAATAELDLLIRDRLDRLSTGLNGSSTQLRSRLTLPFADNLKFIFQNETSISSAADTVLPDRTAVVLDWRVFEGISLRLGQQWFTSGPLSGSNFTTGEVVGDYKVFPDTTLTGRYSVIGGANTTTTQGAIGLNHLWTIAPGFRLSFGYERIFGDNQIRTASGVQVLQPLTTGSNSSTLSLQSGDNYNIGFEYTDNPDFKASTRYEYRTSASGTNSVISASALGKISPSITGLFRYQRSGVANQTINNFGDTANLRLGLAYRDPANDTFNALMRYEYRQNPSTIPQSFIGGIGSGSEDHVFVTEAIYAPNWQWEFYGKYAFRNSVSYLAQDLTGTSAVNLAQLRATYRMGYNFDLTAEGRFINQPTAGFSEAGFVAELGYYVNPNLRLALGYSSGSVNTDRDFSGTRSAGGLYAGITVKLNELFDGFGLQSLAPPQQKVPLDPTTPIELPKSASSRNNITAKVPTAPELVRVALEQPVEFSKTRTVLSAINQVVLDNLVTVLREYPALNVDVQGHLASLNDVGVGSSNDAQRLSNVRTYIIKQGIDSGRVTMRSLGARSENEPKAMILLALGGTRQVFEQISDRINQGSANPILQSVLPNGLPPSGVNQIASAPDIRVQAVSQIIEFAPIGKMTDISSSNLDVLVQRIVSNPSVAIELRGSLEGSPVEVNRLLGLRSYLLQKGIASHRIVISPAIASSSTANSITLTLASLEGVPIAKLPDDLAPSLTPTAQLPRDNGERLSVLFPAIREATIPALLQFQSSELLTLSSTSPSSYINNYKDSNESVLIGQILNIDQRLALQPNTPQNNPQIISTSSTLSLLLTQLINPDDNIQPLAFLPSPSIVSLAQEAQGLTTLLSRALSGLTNSEPETRWSYSPANQVLALLLNEPSVLVAETPTNDVQNRRFMSAFNFLLSRDRDALTALVRSLNESQPELRGELIRPEFFEERQK